VTSGGDESSSVSKDPAPAESRRSVFLFYLAILAVGLLTGFAASALHAALDAMAAARAWLVAPGATGPLPAWLVGAVAGAATTVLAAWAVRRFAPDTAGSGIPEVIGALRGSQALDWRRVLPVKFGAGILGIGGGLVLGREGPTIHLGGALGAMVAGLGRLTERNRLAAITAGAGAGLAAAFNAPLAGIVFVTEEMRREFDFTFRSFQAVILACVAATMVSERLFGLGPVLAIPVHQDPEVQALAAFVPLGVVIGAFGVLFNAALVHRVRVFGGLPRRHPLAWAGLVGAVAGLAIVLAPTWTGGGEALIVTDVAMPPGLDVLLILVLARTAMLVASYSTGVPGGLFAPMLSIGTAIGLAYGALLAALGLDLGIGVGAWGIAAMGALFAATVRAPLTGIVVVVEMTGSTDMILAIMVTAIVATFTAEALGGRPIYSQLAGGRGNH